MFPIHCLDALALAQETGRHLRTEAAAQRRRDTSRARSALAALCSLRRATSHGAPAATTSLPPQLTWSR